MIPQFPESKQIEIADKDEISTFITEYPLFSDFSFISLYSYDTDTSRRLSILNNNLVVEFSDYITRKKFYSFIGQTYTDETIQTLLLHSRKKGMLYELKMIPEVCIANLKNISSFQVEDDRDNFDYVLSIPNLLSEKLGHHSSKKRQKKQFDTLYPHVEITILDFSDVSVQEQVYDLCIQWQKEKQKSDEESINELTAIKRIADAAQQLDITLLGLCDNQSLIAFGIYTVGGNKYAEFHFAKALTTYKGIYAALYIAVAKSAAEKGCGYMNIEQDLGILGLRNTKMQWNPEQYLKKYIISLKEHST